MTPETRQRITDRIGKLTKDVPEIGLKDLQRQLFNSGHALDGPEVSRLLKQLGWYRIGTLGQGYDSQSLYVRKAA